MQVSPDFGGLTKRLVRARPVTQRGMTPYRNTPETRGQHFPGASLDGKAPTAVEPSPYWERDPQGKHADESRARCGVGRNGDPQGDDYGLPRIDIVVPDDARELDRDLVAYRREQRQRRRRARWRRMVRPVTRFCLATPVIAAAVLIAVISATLLTVLGPNSVPRPSATPAVPRPSAGAGQIGGPLPDAQITVSGRPAALRDQRPAVIVFVPPDCRCDLVVSSIARQASARRIGVYLVAG